jgi:regulator of nucleoside diphosphate kinase
MKIDIRYVNVSASDALGQSTRRRLARVLRPFQGRIDTVEVRVVDINGPRGGVDKQVTVMAHVRGAKNKIIVTSESDDAYAAVQEACNRLAESVSRAVARQRELPVRAEPSGEQIPAEARIRVTASDYERLRSVIDASSTTRDRDAVDALSEELDRAEVVPPERIGADTVTMNSEVVFQDESTGDTREATLVYPKEGDPERGRISVLAPIGSALLGLAVGQTIDWPLPGGKRKRLRVQRIVYQPEQAGHWHL